ncbi:FHA domain-containing protein [Leptothoe sp. PORK10 BA2]|uniref:FHA domain-containing protein n=1 Tax=Leptothoe sp. PORK10 BA2 TaxID=3110254 RepID=UPI002B203E02|nr:FHA domain-containing protein [Leptothoe sp. PORK10 BA2]MEA5462835.1 FHA domain-containing protein [Leptothoe sp. PORK10 BA2]
MIICPNCNYQNPEAASQCEACYTPLPSLIICANCGAKVQADASFCGQCGHSLANQSASAVAPATPSAPRVAPSTAAPPTAPLPFEPMMAPTSPMPPAASTPLYSGSLDLVEPEPLVPPEPLPISSPPISSPPPPLPADPSPATLQSAVDIYSSPPITTQPTVAEVNAFEVGAPEGNIPEGNAPNLTVPQTQIQSFTAKLLHVQTNSTIELPVELNLLHIGKPNDRIPPDIDVSGFPESEIVSRVHANIRIEGDVHYIEDVGSSNGTYINNLPLAAGNRHRLRPGDRIALGKGDKVSFIFQLA